MKQKCFIFVLAFLVFRVFNASAQPQFSLVSNPNEIGTCRFPPLCVFKGNLDCARKKVQLKFSFPDKGQISFESTEKNLEIIDFKIYLKDFKLLLFNITTGIVGTAKIVKRPDSDPAIHGIMVADQGMSSKDIFPHRISGNFEIQDDKIFLKHCVWDGLTAQGYFSFLPPYDTDLDLRLDDVLLSDLFAWLGQEKIYTQGDFLGQIHFSGFLNRLALNGKLNSSGQVGDFRYDNISAGFEGVYPVVKLVETNVTAEAGVSFDLEGEIDLSKNFKSFSEQLAKMAMLPLIRATDVDREWTIRRQKDGRKEGETEFKYRLKKEREVSGVEEPGTLTIQHSIKF